MFEQQSFSGDTLGADIAGMAAGERTSAFQKCELSAANMSTKQPSIGGHAATLKDYGRPSIRRRGDSIMDRRVFVTLIAGTCLLEPFAVRAQQSGKVFDWIARSADRTGKCGPDRFGVSSDGSARSWLGGRHLVIETRWAGAIPQRQRELAAELKALPVTLILALGTTAIRAARDGAPGLPIVMISAGDPVGAGFAATLARPGGDLGRAVDLNN